MAPFQYDIKWDTQGIGGGKYPAQCVLSMCFLVTRANVPNRRYKIPMADITEEKGVEDYFTAMLCKENIFLPSIHHKN